jgi:hypothetical protein
VKNKLTAKNGEGGEEQIGAKKDAAINAMKIFV